MAINNTEVNSKIIKNASLKLKIHGEKENNLFVWNSIAMQSHIFASFVSFKIVHIFFMRLFFTLRKCSFSISQKNGTHRKKNTEQTVNIA